MKDFTLAVLNFVLGLLGDLIRGVGSFLITIPMELIGKFIEILGETKSGKVILFLLGLNFFLLALGLIELAMSVLYGISFIQKMGFGEQLRIAIDTIDSTGIKNWGREALKFSGPVSLTAIAAELGFSYRRRKKSPAEISKCKDNVA